MVGREEEEEDPTGGVHLSVRDRERKILGKFRLRNFRHRYFRHSNFRHSNFRNILDIEIF